ncbi:MAG: ABC transporter permease subunit [Armatimonadetes bacterium]|nr:ABC transporter permease subunit [Armatimonadota bacterium]
MSETAGPIADLSYRGYDGPRRVSIGRWWPIAKNGLRVTLRKKGFWVLVVLAYLPYVLLMMQLFVFSRMPEGAGIRFEEMLAQSYSSWYWVLFVALIVGAGSIAADNRSNALQIYLAKPITKGDYLFGKWLSIFIIVYAVVFIPVFGTVLYAALSEGMIEFMREHGWLLPKAFLIAAVPATVHASLLVGISAWNRLPWLAGTIYAAVFFFWNGFTTIFGSVLQDRLSDGMSATVQHLSLQGVITGLGTNLIGVAQRSMFRPETQPLPDWRVLLVLGFAACAIGLFLARTHIRAVEVVKG